MSDVPTYLFSFLHSLACDDDLYDDGCMEDGGLD